MPLYKTATSTHKVGETKNRQLYNYNTLLFKVTASYQLKLIQSRRLIEKKSEGKMSFHCRLETGSK